jgi:hypothetical protein
MDLIGSSQRAGAQRRLTLPIVVLGLSARVHDRISSHQRSHHSPACSTVNVVTVDLVDVGPEAVEQGGLVFVAGGRFRSIERIDIWSDI